MKEIFEAKVIENRQLSDDTFYLAIAAPKMAANARPGNFVMVHPASVCGGIAPITPRPFSIFSLLGEVSNPIGFSLIIKKLGKGTEVICRARKGDVLRLTGPLGNHLPIEKERTYLLAAGGTGIAPVTFTAQILERLCIPYGIYYGGRSVNDVFLDELEKLGISAEIATEDGSFGHHGLVTDILRPALKRDYGDVTVFACGPWKMMEAVSRIAQETGRECYCSLERYMACGIGVCLACVYRKKDDDHYHTCCKEGPIVRGKEVDWNA